MEITFSELIEHLESFPVKNNFQFIHFQCDGKVIVEFNIITAVLEKFILFYFMLTISGIYGTHQKIYRKQSTIFFIQCTVGIVRLAEWNFR